MQPLLESLDNLKNEFADDPDAVEAINRGGGAGNRTRDSEPIPE